MANVEFLFSSDGEPQFIVKELRFIGAIHLKKNMGTKLCIGAFDGFIHEFFPSANSLLRGQDIDFVHFQFCAFLFNRQEANV